jgi:hypothetical protein
MARELKKIGVEAGVGVATLATACLLGPAAALALLVAGGAVVLGEITKHEKPASGSKSRT